ncbi:hypothetical protein DWU95_42365, partial [Burkholderia contaminans]
MNHSFRSIWSETTCCWVAVAETARARATRPATPSRTSRRTQPPSTHTTHHLLLHHLASSRALPTRPRPPTPLVTPAPLHTAALTPSHLNHTPP